MTIMNYAQTFLLSLTNNTNMDYDKKFDEYTYGYTLISVQSCGGVLNVFTNDFKTAKQTLVAYEEWTKHFLDLSQKFPDINGIYKVEIKRMLNFKHNNSYVLSDMTLDELKSKIS